MLEVLMEKNIPFVSCCLLYTHLSKRAHDNSAPGDELWLRVLYTIPSGHTGEADSV